MVIMHPFKLDMKVDIHIQYIIRAGALKLTENYFLNNMEAGAYLNRHDPL